VLGYLYFDGNKYVIEIGKGLTPLSLSHHPAYGTVPRRFNRLKTSDCIILEV
jgi:hypothetical protein